MNVHTTSILAILASVTFKVVQASIMCSTCRSDKMADCESRPPPPQPCPESGSGVVKSCSTIKIFKMDTNDLHQFIRSCSSSEKAGCFKSQPGYKTCAEICYSDGCNSASAAVAVSWLFLLLPVAVLSMLCNSLC